jgi:ornithine cyclodeaminase/alanine dehydrogenase-like protein (mu-crystallin family)
MDRVIALLEAGFRSWSAGTAVCQPRQRVRAPGGSMLQLMGAADSQAGYIGYKAYTTSRSGNYFYVMLFDAVSGKPLALIEADYLGQMRTGAASGLATKYMARADAYTLGVIGTGGQAFTQIQAIAAVRELAEVRVFGRDQERCKDFASRVSAAFHLTVRACESAREAVAGAAIVTTVTTSSQPVFFGAWIEPGMHINAAGGNAASRSELDAAAVLRADRIVADSIEQSKIESGELRAVDRWSVVVEVSEVVAGKAAGRGSAGEVTLFKSNGIALEDIALSGWLFEQIK